MTTTTPAASSLRPVREYLCRWCERRGLPYAHREGFEPEFGPHVVFQGRHTYAERGPTPAEVFRREVEEQPWFQREVEEQEG